ncbi:hypothetical protein AB1Y20_000117 [Prymnesium parvum]|uniref:Uncharacterized protein n=1 Tax=Prymnesium parvum TaxID=97485 RepID=A0AB34K3Q2_PRYPA
MDEDSLRQAQARAATRIAATQRGHAARAQLSKQDAAAAKLQAVQRGRVARRRRFVVAEATHAATRVSKPAATEAVGAARKPLTPKQLGLSSRLPKNPVAQLQFLTFWSWYVEMGTKRWIEICFDLETELFQIVLDKHVSVLNPTHANAALFDTLKSVTSQETRVLSMHLHEKLSGNQHAESLRRPHLECWDLHVGAKINILGRPTTLMQCSLDTARWLGYHAERLRLIKNALEVNLTKYEPVPIVSAFKSDKPQGLGQSRIEAEGTADLRQLMNQVEALQLQLSRYRPAIASQLAAMAEGP